MVISLGREKKNVTQNSLLTAKEKPPTHDFTSSLVLNMQKNIRDLSFVKKNLFTWPSIVLRLSYFEMWNFRIFSTMLLNFSLISMVMAFSFLVTESEQCQALFKWFFNQILSSRIFLLAHRLVTKLSRHENSTSVHLKVPLTLSTAGSSQLKSPDYRNICSQVP